jgi:DNA-binding NtrC family response regulator
MAAGRFRKDLYYRLCSDIIVTPALEEQLRVAPGERGALVRFLARRVAGEAEAEPLAERPSAGSTRSWATAIAGRATSASSSSGCGT